VVRGIVNRYQYNAWGEILSQTESVAQPFKFAGAEYDALTGLYKMGARYYDPAIGRFTQPDPFGGGYQYARNDPINFIDPTGYGPLETIWEVIKIIVTAKGAIDAAKEVKLSERAADLGCAITRCTQGPAQGGTDPETGASMGAGGQSGAGG